MNPIQPITGPGQELLRPQLATASIDDGTVARAWVSNVNGLHDLTELRSKVKCEWYCTNNTGWTRNWNDLRPEMETGAGDEEIARMIQAGTLSMSAAPTTASTWAMGPAGMYPVVPAAIGGDPYAMRYRTTHASEAAPVRIWVDLCCSTAVDKTNFAKVMAVLASGVIAIAEHRPIELMALAALGWPSSSGDAWIITSPIDVQSLDARSLAVWCDPSVGRTAILPLHTACGGSSYDKPFGPGTGENRIKRIRAILGVEPDDIVLPPLFGADGQQAIAKRMVELMVKTGVECNVDEVIRSINSINSSNEHAPTKTAPKPRRRRRRF